MATAMNGTLPIHWDEAGTGTPVLLIMGHLYSSEMWYPILPALTAEHRVVWFDNRGSGKSGMTRTAVLTDLVADARAVMDAAGLDQAHVFGVSMGGGIALKLAHESPERVTSLLLGCTALKSERLEEGRTKQPRTALRYHIPIRLLRGVFRKGYGPAADPAVVERDLDVLCRLRFSPRGIYAQNLAIQTYDMTPDKVAELTMPALVLHGTADQAVPYERAGELVAALPNGRLITYPDTGHNFIVERGEQANADVLGFLGEVDAA